MKRTGLALALIVIMVLFATSASAQEIVIDDAFTMNYLQEPTTEFKVWDPVMYSVEYTITGNPGRTYKVIVVIRTMGDKIRITERQRPGTHTTVTSNLARADDVDTHTVTYEVKLKKGALLDTDSTTSQITVSQ
jgi:hypothetical protein